MQLIVGISLALLLGLLALVLLLIVDRRADRAEW